MSKMVERVAYEMQRYMLEDHVDGTFFIVDGYRDSVVREKLTADDEPLDIVDGMNARSAIGAMREPTADMVMFNGEITGRDDAGFGLTEGDAIRSWRGFIDAALK